MNVDLKQNYKQYNKQKMKTIQQKKINQLRKDLEWYRLYANYIESHFTILGDNACDYADEKTKEVTNASF